MDWGTRRWTVGTVGRNMTDLRDHSQPCDHDDSYRTGEFWFCETCPGGRVVTDAELVRMAAEAQKADSSLAAIWADVFIAAIEDSPSTVTSADWFNQDDNI